LFQLVKRFCDVFQLKCVYICERSAGANGSRQRFERRHSAAAEVTNAKHCSAVAAATVPG